MNQIVSIVTANPVTVLTDEKTYSEFYTAMKAEVSAHVPDVSTEKGRKEIASLAYKVTRTKTAIDAAGKKLNEEARAQINAVDASRRKIREELDALAIEARQPLTDWEDAEEAREVAVKEAYASIASLATVGAEDGSNLIADRLAQVQEIELPADIFRDDLAGAEATKQAAISKLTTALARVRQHEADQAELARLRAEQEERERAEREARERAEVERIAKERAEREAEERRHREAAAAEAARLEEQRKAKAAIEKAEREKAEAIAKAEAEARAVKEKADREERERLAAADKLRREEDARAADRKHRAAVMSAAKVAMMDLGADEDTARKIVLAIIADEIPHVSLRF